MIFPEWKKQKIHQGEGKIFIKDGIIDPEKWNNAPVKILFLLKEAYEKQDKKEDQEYCQWVRGLKSLHGQSTTWKRMSEWIYGIFKLKEHGKLFEFPKDKYCDDKDKSFDDKDRLEYLRSVAVVNIKKSNGKSGSAKEDLEEYIESDWTFLKKQMDYIDPELIVYGNLPCFLWEKLNFSGAEEISEWVYFKEGKFIVNFWHPSNRFPKKMSYYALCSALEISGVLNKNKR